MSPATILHGIDVSNRQFPEDHPTNMSFSVCSVLSLPESWDQRFDFIHQRLLVGALKTSEWPVAFSNMYRALKPGGWVQIGEYSEWDAPMGVESATARHKRIHYALFNARRLDLDIYAKIPGLLSDAGFVHVNVETLRVPLGKTGGNAGTDGSRNLIAVFRALKVHILREGGFGFVHSEAEIDKLIDDVAKEWDETEGYGVDFPIVCAQRPQTL